MNIEVLIEINLILISKINFIQSILLDIIS